MMRKRFDIASVIWRIVLIIVVLLPGPAEATVEPGRGSEEIISTQPVSPIDIASTVDTVQEDQLKARHTRQVSALAAAQEDGATTAPVPDVPVADPVQAGQASASSTASSPAAGVVTIDSAPPNDRLGINFVDYPTWQLTEEQYNLRYQGALDAGATWTRWVLYFSNWTVAGGAYQGVDADGNPFNYDALVERVEDRNLEQVVILQGPNPPPASAYAPATITEGGETVINPDNPWATFVYQTVNRYRGNVHHWEIWNEPDIHEWAGTPADYYHLLQVAYLTIHYTDPDAKVLLPAFSNGGNRPFADLLIRRFAI